ncbi:hypothetical protein TNCV_770711 [Trichonephila clavipes]|nr:hypothetical protein TNCV_770711 [Trichonephila clavipes]
MQVFDLSDHRLKGRVSCTPNSSGDHNQIHFTFCPHLQRSCNVEHASSGNVSGTAAGRVHITIRTSMHDQHVDQFVA